MFLCDWTWKTKGDFLGYKDTTRLLTGRRDKLPSNPSELTGDALWKKATEFDRNNNLG
jgi:hypothetical protein